MPSLFDPVASGEIQGRNRILMAPMTRARAHADGVLNTSAVEYYRQRSEAGVIISERPSFRRLLSPTNSDPTEPPFAK